MIVTLDILSGRPNPSWPLMPGRIAELQMLVASLNSKAPGGVEPPGLGYRGFRLHGDDIIAEAFGSILCIDGNFLHDPDRTIERFLLGTMPREFEHMASRVAMALASNG